jgi:glutamate dehydrogenase/leucine dehydrogenase
MRFCQSFMTELSSIGANTDVPAGISVLEEEKLDVWSI